MLTRQLAKAFSEAGNKVTYFAFQRFQVGADAGWSFGLFVFLELMVDFPAIVLAHITNGSTDSLSLIERVQNSSLLSDATG